jgi:hypothetical protein
MNNQFRRGGGGGGHNDNKSARNKQDTWLTSEIQSYKDLETQGFGFIKPDEGTSLQNFSIFNNNNFLSYIEITVSVFHHPSPCVSISHIHMRREMRRYKSKLRHSAPK